MDVIKHVLSSRFFAFCQEHPDSMLFMRPGDRKKAATFLRGRPVSNIRQNVLGSTNSGVVWRGEAPPFKIRSSDMCGARMNFCEAELAPREQKIL